jgi:secondary thiamine-phosphate synthase enzyme
MWFQGEITLAPRGQGLHEFTAEVRRLVSESGVQRGLCHVFVCHTSASLVIQENADPSARRDLEQSIALLAPENATHYTHTAEGPDDMPSHVRAALTRTSETVPIADGHLALGTWQGIFLFEHRRRPGRRRIVVTVTGE